MKRINILLLAAAILLTPAIIRAQKIDTATVVISGGNAIIISIPKTGPGSGRTISRSVGSNSGFIQIGVLKRPETFAEFRAIAGDTIVTGLKKLKKLGSDKELWDFIQSDPSYKAYGLAMANLKFLKAIGWAYVDNSISTQPKGTKVYYQVIDPANAEADTGSCITGHPSNEQKPMLTDKESSDSLIYLRWGYQTFSHQLLPRYAYIYRKTVTGLFIKQALSAYATYTKDSVYYGMSQHVKPNQEFSYYIQPVDFFNNAINVRSDTVSMVSVNFKRIPPLVNVTAKDTINGILISWKKPKPNIFLRSILIQRSGTVTGIYTKVADLALSDSVYMDRDIKPGETYYYRLKITGQKEVSSPQTNFSGFASAYHSDKHNKPNAPYGLTADAGDIGVKLSWQAVNNPSIAGYYVYRSNGADTMNMQMVSRLIKTTTYTDSTKNQSRRSNYIYAVKAVNLADVKSNYSAIVQAKLPYGVDIPITPAFINVTRNNNELLIQWQNTRLGDNYIKGYILYRHKIQTGEHLLYDVKKPASVEALRLGFTRISAGLLSDPGFTETISSDGTPYEYAVAAIDITGAESGLSSVAYEQIAAYAITAPLSLNIIYINNKVQLTWLQASAGALTGYTIYRKANNEKVYKKIGSVTAKELEYVDNTVEPQKVYLYKVKSLGEQGESKGFAANSIKIL